MSELSGAAWVALALAALWIAVAVILSVAAARRIRSAGAVVASARSMAALLDVAPARPLLVRPDGRIEIDPRLHRLLIRNIDRSIFAEPVVGEHDQLLGHRLRQWIIRRSHHDRAVQTHSDLVARRVMRMRMIPVGARTAALHREDVIVLRARLDRITVRARAILGRYIAQSFLPRVASR